MADPKPGDDWSERRAKLDARLGTHRQNERSKAEAESKPGSMQGMAQGLKIASEFISGVVVGAFIGYGIDTFFDTRPFGLIVFLMFGFAAGVLNVVRGAKSSSGTDPSA